MIKSSSIKRYTLVLIYSFFFLALVTSVISFRFFQNLKINGSQYKEIHTYKNLKVMIFPPTLYIIEAYSMMERTLLEENPAFLQQMSQVEANYHRTFKLFSQIPLSSSVKDLLLKHSHTHVTKFFHIFHEEFYPAIEKQDFNAARTVFKENTRLFYLHKQLIEEASLEIDQFIADLESRAEKQSNTFTSLLLMTNLIFFTMFISVSVLLFLRIRKNESELLKSQAESTLLNVFLEDSVKELMRFKHNFDNLLASMKGFVQNNDYEGLKQSIGQLEIDTNKITAPQYNALARIKNNGLIGLIIAKLELSKEKNLQFLLQVPQPLPDIPMKSHHLCEVVGILLDNAIEAAQKSEPKKVWVDFFRNDDHLSISIRNTLSTEIEYIKKCLLAPVRTKEHGYGLSIAHKIIQNYDNVVLNTLVRPHCVEQELVIFDFHKPTLNV